MSSSGTPAAAAARNLMRARAAGAKHHVRRWRASHAWPAHREPPRRETVAPYLVRSAEPNPLSATRGGRSVEGAGAGVRGGGGPRSRPRLRRVLFEAFFDFDAGVFDFADGFSAGDLFAGVFSAGVFSAGVFSAGVFASAVDFLAGVFALGVLAGASLLRAASRGRRASDARRRARGRTPSPSPCHRVCASRAERPLPLPLPPLPRRSLPGLPREVELLSLPLRHQHRLLLATAASPRDRHLLFFFFLLLLILLLRDALVELRREIAMDRFLLFARGRDGGCGGGGGGGLLFFLRGGRPPPRRVPSGRGGASLVVEPPRRGGRHRAPAIPGRTPEWRCARPRRESTPCSRKARQSRRGRGPRLREIRLGGPRQQLMESRRSTSLSGRCTSIR